MKRMEQSGHIFSLSLLLLLRVILQIKPRDKEMISPPPNISANHSSSLPYLACLIPGLPTKTEEVLRFMRNSFFLPLELISAILSLLCNLPLVIAVARIRTRQHPSLTFFCSLSVSYLFLSLFHLYKSIWTLVHIHQCLPKDNAQRFIGGLCLILTLCNMALISQDRHRSISRPLWYQNHMTKSRARKQCIIALSSCVVVLTVFRELRWLCAKFLLVTKITALVFFIACSFMIFSFQVAIYVEVKKIHRKNVPCCGARHSAAALTREKKISKTVGLIILVLVLTHLPALIFSLFFLIKYKGMHLALFRPFLSALFCFNGILDPIITFKRNKAIQRSLRQFFCFQDRRQGPLWAAVSNKPTLRKGN